MRGGSSKQLYRRGDPVLSGGQSRGCNKGNRRPFQTRRMNHFTSCRGGPLKLFSLRGLKTSLWLPFQSPVSMLPSNYNLVLHFTNPFIEAVLNVAIIKSIFHLTF